MANQPTTHFEEIVRLKRIEGQVRGIQRMIEESILERHLKGCVQESLTGGDADDRIEKISEVIEVLKKFRKC